MRTYVSNVIRSLETDVPHFKRDKNPSVPRQNVQHALQILQHKVKTKMLFFFLANRVFCSRPGCHPLHTFIVGFYIWLKKISDFKTCFKSCDVTLSVSTKWLYLLAYLQYRVYRLSSWYFKKNKLLIFRDFTKIVWRFLMRN